MLINIVQINNDLRRKTRTIMQFVLMLQVNTILNCHFSKHFHRNLTIYRCIQRKRLNSFDVLSIRLILYSYNLKKKKHDVLYRNGLIRLFQPLVSILVNRQHCSDVIILHRFALLGLYFFKNFSRLMTDNHVWRVYRVLLSDDGDFN